MTTGQSASTAPMMLREAEQAPEAIEGQLKRNLADARALANTLRSGDRRFVVTSARGSSAHAATFGKYLIETRLGLVTAAAAPSVATLYGATLDMGQAVFLAVSQSGRSPASRTRPLHSVWRQPACIHQSNFGGAGAGVCARP